MATITGGYSQPYRTPVQTPRTYANSPTQPSLRECIQELDTARAKMREMAGVIEQLSSDRNRYKQKGNLLQEDYDRLLAEVKDLKDINNKLTITVRERETKEFSLTSQIAELKEKASILEDSAQAEKLRRERTEADYLSTLQSIQMKAEKEHTAMKKREQEFRDKENELQQRIDSALHSKEAEIMTQQKEKEEKLQSRIDSLTKELDECKNEIEQLNQNHLQDLERQREETTSTLNEYHTSMQTTMDREHQLRQEIAGLNEDLLKKELEHRRELDEKEREISKLKDELRVEQEARADDKQQHSRQLEREKANILREAEEQKTTEHSTLTTLLNEANRKLTEKTNTLARREEEYALAQKQIAQLKENLDDAEREAREESKRREESYDRMMTEQRTRWNDQFIQNEEKHRIEAEAIQQQHENELEAMVQTMNKNTARSEKFLKEKLSEIETERRAIQEERKEMEEKLRREARLQVDRNTKQLKHELDTKEKKAAAEIKQLRDENKQLEEKLRIDKEKMTQQLERHKQKLKSEREKAEAELLDLRKQNEEAQQILSEKETVIVKMRERFEKERQIEKEYNDEVIRMTENEKNETLRHLNEEFRRARESLVQKETTIRSLNEMAETTRQTYEQHIQNLKGQAAVELKLRDDLIAQLQSDYQSAVNDRDIFREQTRQLQQYLQQQQYEQERMSRREEEDKLNESNQTWRDRMEQILGGSQRSPEDGEWETVKKEYRSGLRDLQNVLDKLRDDPVTPAPREVSRDDYAFSRTSHQFRDDGLEYTSVSGYPIGGDSILQQPMTPTISTTEHILPVFPHVHAEYITRPDTEHPSQTRKTPSGKKGTPKKKKGRH
ncbi:hypothetical protein BLNAU_729 [Blattamonas nauphoetae]|uniref:Uncharacterized protein n=1 Tax=Blattamonas nauphoetae TaxID=2049346 RepID=A0ABQ9YKC1_9EUKA|nr:hypothetical protein BLNAU_729 [Blattamonas nauphoetae]